MRLRWLTLTWLVAALACGAGQARAQGMSPAEILQQFNVVTFGSFSSSADVEGRAVIGGNMNGGATFALNVGSEAASALGALSVYGNETASGSFNVDGAGGVAIAGSNAGGFTLNAGGSVYIGGRNTAAVTINGGSMAGNSVAINGNNSGYLTLNSGGSVKVNGKAGSGTLNGGSLSYTTSKGSWTLNGGATTTKMASLSLPAPANLLPSFASTFQQPLTALSTQLAALTPTSTVLTSGNSVTLEAKPASDGVAVLDISTSVFKQNSTVSVAMNGASSLIINLSVAGCSSNCSYTVPNSVNFQNPTGYAESVLWNVTDVSSLSFTNEFGGTVLAPYATVTNTSAIDGSLIAMAFQGAGELHDYPFKGALPAAPVRTPEPSGLAVMAVALLGTGAAGWRRRARRGL